MKKFAAFAVALVVLAGASPALAEDEASITLAQDDTALAQDQAGIVLLESEQSVEPVDVHPLGSSAYKGDLSGYKNGSLPDDLLREVPAGANEACLLEADAAVAWELLTLAAEQDGVTGFAAGWCYRSLAAQQRTYDRNCKLVQPPAPPAPEPAPAPEKKKSKKGEEPEPAPPPAPAPPLPPAKLVCSAPTAKPGTSNHGWGRAIDVVDTTGTKASVLSCGDPQFAWLLERGAEFGWVLPSWAHCGSNSQEPWHFEWAGLTAPISQLIIGSREARDVELPR